MKILHTHRFLAVILLVSVGISHAQEEGYREWLEKDQQQYEQFLEEEDRAFAEFLKKDWERFQTYRGKPFDPKPKPVDMPTVKKENKPQIPVVEPTRVVEDIPLPDYIPEPQETPKPEPVTEPQKPRLEFTFFGQSLQVNFKKQQQKALKQEMNNDVISEAWKQMAAIPHKAVVQQLQKHAATMRLNDWGYVLLVHNFSRTAYPDSPSRQTLFSWFLLNKSGLDAKVAYQSNSVFLLLPVNYTIFEKQFTAIDKQKYYFMEFNRTLDTENRVYTYRGRYEGAEKAVDLEIKSAPRIHNEVVKKRLRFDYNDSNIEFEIEYNRDMVRFFEDYPQTELTLFLKAGTSEPFKFSLLKALKPYVAGKSEYEAVNFLLRFVQTAFRYQTDDQQFGREKYMLPEETIFYPASDCEDRSILFAFLVRELLGLDMIMLDYPGHISTAVKFHGKIGGEAVEFRGERYIICDPTYVNAGVGMVMPDYKGINPQVVSL